MFENQFEDGLALRRATPQTQTGSLVAMSRLRANSARWIKAGLGFVTVAAAAATTLISLRPISARAALGEAARHSNSVRPMHVINKGEDVIDSDLWFLSDRLLGKSRFSMREVRADGEGRSYVEGCPAGHRYVVDKYTKDLIANPEVGTIGKQLELDEHERNAHVDRIDSRRYLGRNYTDYRVTDSNLMGAHVADYFVDPGTNLIQQIEEDRISPDGKHATSQTDVEYPDAQTAAREEPKFPAGISFLTDEQIQAGFLSSIRKPEQVKTVHGVHVAFYGLILRCFRGPEPYSRAFSVTRGGATADTSQDQYVQFADGPIASQTVLAVGPGRRMGHLVLGPPTLRSGRELIGDQVRLGGSLYVVNCANQMLSRVPKEITVRVPVWEPSGQTLISQAEETKGQKFQGRRLLGYATFSTHRIFCDNGSETLDLFHLTPSPGAFNGRAVKVGSGAPVPSR